MSMNPMLNIAIFAVRKAGDLIIRYYENNAAVETCMSNLITKINNEVESLIIKVIHKYYPMHSILSEKQTESVKKNYDIQWIIDPLDGSINFIKRFPHFAVSIAVCVKGRTEIAVIYDPIRNELFSASRGQSAQLNNHRLRISTVNNLDNTVLAICLPLQQKQKIISYITLLSKQSNIAFRCTGSVALDLAYVAAGRVDGFLETGLDPWILASGELLVREAGGLIVDFTGCYNHIFAGNLIASNPRIVKNILSIIQHGAHI